jgi:hypothetical protein
MKKTFALPNNDNPAYSFIPEMKRAAILIGVDRTGGLPTLQDASRGARRFEAWAREQGFNAVEVFTDENGGSVEVAQLKKAIKKIVDAGTTEQLIIYFAGHGVNIGYSEYWLLTDAPGDSQAAVNVRGSAMLAAYCGIPHVVFISDACRTAAEGGRAQRVTGSEIFPNEGAGDLEKPVDIFYACTLGRPALEVRDGNTTAREFKALYTTAMLAGLRGEYQEAVERTVENGKPIAFIRPRPLKAVLIAEVPRQIANLNLQTKAVQIPDAHIVSDPKAWIARVSGTPGVNRSPGSDTAGVPVGGTRTGRIEVPVTPSSISTVSNAMLHKVLSTDLTKVASEFDLERVLVPGASEFIDTALHAAAPFGQSHHETACGFKVRGGKFVDAFSHSAITELFENPGDVIRVNHVDHPGSSVLLEFDGGNGVVLPAIPGFLAALTIVDGELVDVAYEPSDNTMRWNEFAPRASEIRALRAVASSSTRSGVFRLEGDDALAVARQMQLVKGIDPSLAVYAAYAYNDLNRHDLIRKMSGYMQQDLGACLFDLALLGRKLKGQTVGKELGILSFVPLLSQGWAYLGAQQVKLPDSLEELQGDLVPSVWTLFNKDGVAKIRSAMKKGHVL